MEAAVTEVVQAADMMVESKGVTTDSTGVSIRTDSAQAAARTA